MQMRMIIQSVIKINNLAPTKQQIKKLRLLLRTRRRWEIGETMNIQVGYLPVREYQVVFISKMLNFFARYPSGGVPGPCDNNLVVIPGIPRWDTWIELSSFLHVISRCSCWGARGMQCSLVEQLLGKVSNTTQRKGVPTPPPLPRQRKIILPKNPKRK